MPGGALGTIGGTGTGGAGAEAPAEASCPSYDEVRAQIFGPYCVSCHSGDAPSGAVHLDAQHGAESRAQEVASTIESGLMPLGGPRLSPDLSALATRWATCL